MVTTIKCYKLSNETTTRLDLLKGELKLKYKTTNITWDFIFAEMLTNSKI